METKRVEIDTGFVLEKKIKEYKEGVDYEVDKTGNFYTILSEGLKSVIWPNDYVLYNESVVAIDRQGKVESWRIAADNPREPYEKVVKGGLQEIMSDFDDSKKAPANKKNESVNIVLEKDTKEMGKKNIIFWMVVIFLLLAIFLSFLFLKKVLICQKINKKNYGIKQ